MGRGIYSGIKYNMGSNRNKFVPLPHQLQTLEMYIKAIETPGINGMVLYHKLGSGKTCTSILIADTLLQTGYNVTLPVYEEEPSPEKVVPQIIGTKVVHEKIRHVFVASQGSLRQNWLTEYANMCGKNSRYLDENYTFITYNYNIAKGLEEVNFLDSLVIIDEAHMLMNGVKLGSKNATVLYNKIKESQCKVLLLTGTPILIDPADFYYFGVLVKPGMYEVDKGYIFNPESEFLGTPDEFLSGVISYFPGSGEEYYPEVITMGPVKTKMTEKQNFECAKAYDLETKIILALTSKPTPLTEQEKQQLTVAAKRIVSRSISNAYYPEFSSFEDKIEDPKDENNKGWISKDALINKVLYWISPKITALILNIILHVNQKHVIFSFYKTKCGLHLIQSLLKLAGISTLLFTGDLTDRDRKSVLDRFNDPRNREGKYYLVLLCSDAGAQGISILEARHVHILESGTREIMIQQAIGRVIRYKSHWNMKKEDQNVKVWRYWSVSRLELNEGPQPKGTKCVDEIVYENGQSQLVEINRFLEILHRYSVTDYVKEPPLLIPLEYQISGIQPRIDLEESERVPPVTTVEMIRAARKTIGMLPVQEVHVEDTDSLFIESEDMGDYYFEEDEEENIGEDEEENMERDSFEDSFEEVNFDDVPPPKRLDE